MRKEPGEAAAAKEDVASNTGLMTKGAAGSSGDQQGALAQRNPNAGALATGGLSFEEDAGAGMEGADKDSYAIPFISILQGLSPQLETVEGARPGLFINTITNELFKEIEVIPCAYQRRYLRWARRENGGGYKGEFSVADVEVKGKVGDVPVSIDAETGQFVAGDDMLKDTRNHFVMYKTSAGGWRPALISLSSTQIKRSKRWMALIGETQATRGDGTVYTPPSFANIFVAKPVKEKNAKGEWWVMDFSRLAQVQDVITYTGAKALNKQVAEGAIKVEQPQPDAEDSDSSERF